jgi:hypothetical protein
VSKAGLFIKLFRRRRRQTYAKLTQVIDNFTTVDVLVQRHLAHENGEDELCGRAVWISERPGENTIIRKASKLTVMTAPA